MFALSLVNDLDLFTAEEFETDWATSDIETSLNSTLVDYQRSDPSEVSYGDPLTSLSMFTSTIRIFIRSAFYATVGIPLLMSHFGFPATYGVAVTIFVWLNYIIAIMQILGRTGFKSGM